jgi:phage-related protein
MILDNLGIQVSLSEATERAARSFGVEASALDKTQIQAGMMEVVLEKLAANTAAMPDVSASAAAGLARMGATAQDAKDALGLALQPALAGVMEGVSALAEKFLPLLIDFFEQRVAPVVNKIGEFFKTFAGSLAEGASPADALKTALEAIGLEDVAAKIEDVVDKVIEFRDSVQLLWDKVSDFLKPISDFISENVILQDVLIALAAIILATVVPAVISWVISMGPILLTVAAVIAIVALLRKLCENDFAVLKEAWAAVGQTFEDVGMWIGETVNDIGSWLSKAWNDIKTGAANTWNAITKGITDKVDEIKNKIKDKWSEIKFWLESTMWRIRDNIRDAWDRARQYVVDKVQDMIDRVRNLWSDMKDAGSRLVEGLKDGIRNAWNSFLSWLRGILDDAIGAVKSFFGIHSPSQVFAGIGENLMAGLAEGIGDGVTVPVTTMVDASRDLVDAGSMTMDLRAGQAAGSAGGAQITIYGGLVLHGIQDVPSLLGELQALAV